MPVVPGYHGSRQEPGFLRERAGEIGYPVLIKAVAGGGGKGMRRVDGAAEFEAALAGAQREAESAFGDARVLVEKYVLSPRHIEMQVFADTHGNVVHLFERDCSLQRRHQKVIEEAPAPGMDAATRAAVCEAAVKAAKAVDYVGAGTIEFIADASQGLRADRIWFMEMNTRLQVEHPVTEEITGQDLVEWQLRVASGETLPLRQDELAINGWAMEARLYAEDPVTGFLPSTGPLTYFQISDYSRDGRRRVETGVKEGDLVSPYYDPMIAKLVVHGPDRESAIGSLSDMSRSVQCWPVRTNAAFLVKLLGHPEFAAGEADTGLIARDLEAVLPAERASERVLESVAMMVVDEALGGKPRDIRETYLYRRPSAWSWVRGFRLNAEDAPTLVRLSERAHDYAVEFEEISVGKTAYVQKVDEGYLVSEDGQTFMFTETRVDGAAGSAAGDGAIVSPMPGKLIAVAVRQGQAVTRGQKLVTLEAMKMEHSLVAPFDGIVAELAAVEGAQVSEGTLLARIEKGDGE
ncbi:MAG: 3-methylcrotonyl-CoA carboxylase alpha subunit [Sphingomonadales bacterium]|nr:3-methylcrotonyl-CoA carboxylase alpha subunit [Sphingomonadales bacterium]